MDAGSLEEFDVEVRAVTVEAEDVVALELERPDGGALPAWEPGAHIDLILEPDLERQYSLCGEPEDTQRWTVAVLREREGRGGSAWVHDRLTAGAQVRVRGPRNHFELVPAEAYVFIAGGIGITPLLPMIRRLAAAGADWRLIYGGRRAESMAFTGALERYGERVSFQPEDRCGLLDLGLALGQPEAGRAVYCCGPEGLIEAVEQRCAEWPRGALHVERFSPRPIAPDSADLAFEVVLASSGAAVQVAAGQSIVEALEAAGVDIPTSCREGTCGTCETAVLDGIPDHRDSILMPDEREANDTILPCCSRSLTPRLVLDL